MTTDNDLIEHETSGTADESGEGIIYVIGNAAFSTQVVKIGRAKSLSQRINTLNTAVPLPFICYKASRVKDMIHAEKLLHQTFRHAKNDWRGEFFQVEPEVVAAVLELIEIEDVTSLAPNPTEEDIEIINENVKRAERKENFTFGMVGIPIGKRLSFVDDPEITCEVTSDKTQILYRDEKYSISGLATKLKNSAYSVRGPLYWMYEGETLQQRRERLEAHADNDEDE